MTFVYVYAITDAEQRVKIGISADPQKRLTYLQTGNASKLKIFSAFAPLA